MDVRALLIELSEKMSLLATAALVTVLLPGLRTRLLGVGQPRDKLAALVLGIALSMWGAKLGLHWLDQNINVRAIGIFIAAILGGREVGAAAGILGGLFYVFRVAPEDAPWGIFASTIDGVLAGVLAQERPRLLNGPRAFFTCCAIQLVHVGVIGVGIAIFGQMEFHTLAWPAHLVKLIANAAGVTLFVVVARIVIAREEAAVALVEARAAADAASLEALRRRLEPHFLFNALNTLRATIRKNPDRARTLVADLADLYRYLLTHPEDARLADEVSHACAYLAIERARLGDGRLRVETAIDDDVAHLRVPALLLQPLVENAVKHGVAAHDGEGVVRLSARRDDDLLIVAVENQSEGDKVGVVGQGSGIALETLRKRLARKFRGRASLDLAPIDGGMRASVRLPCLRTEPEPVGALETRGRTTA